MTESQDPSESELLAPSAPALEVLVLFEHQQNREMVSDWLDQQYPIRDEIPEQTDRVGCILTDEGGLEIYHDAIRKVKDSVSPAFLPVLLVTNDAERIPETAWNLADEIVEAPVQKSVLGNRLELLVQTREQSLELKRQRKQSEERFHRLFQTAPDPVLIVERDGTIVDVNDAFVELVETEYEDLVGENVLDVGFQPAETLDRILFRLDDASDPSGRTVSFQAEGQTHVAELNAEVLHHLGKSTERIGIFRDVTERRQSREGLERKVERLDDFTSIVTHDLRNPLTIAKGKLTLAQEDCDTSELDDIAAMLDRMEELIQQLLDFARSGTLVTDPSVVNLAEVANEAAELVAEADGVDVAVETDATIYADEDQLTRIFDNLYRNAVEHNEPPVGILVGDLEDGFFVEDDGSGIPPSKREEVLTMRNTTADGGSGLGLPIVKNVAEAHQWTMAIETGDAGGARFAFRGVDAV